MADVGYYQAPLTTHSSVPARPADQRDNPSGPEGLLFLRQSKFAA